MAIDSKNKRMSMIGFGQVFIATLPEPDGTIVKAERPMFLHLYQGLTLDVVEVVAYAANIVMRIIGLPIVVSLFKRAIKVDVK